MDDPEFAPFSPRRIVSVATQAPAARSDAIDASDRDEPPEPSVAGAGDGDSEERLASRPEAEDGEAPATAAPEVPEPAESEAAPQERCPSAAPAETRCDHSIEIRNEAVRLAAIACGRALRHALVLHPRVIASFVDDALRCAGYPQVSRIRVHPDSLVAASASLRAVTGDDRLAPGDIWIDLEGASVGADLVTRAELLAAAAAET